MLKQFKQLKLSEPKQKTSENKMVSTVSMIQLSVAGVHRWFFGTLLAERPKVPHIKPERTRLNSISSYGLQACLAGESKRNSESLLVASEWPEAQLVAFRNTQKSLHFCFPSATAPQRPAVLWCSHMLLHVLAQLHL